MTSRRHTPVHVLTVLTDIPLPADTGLHLRMVGNLAVVRELGAVSSLLCFSTEERTQSVALLGDVAGLVDHVAYAGPRRPQQNFGRGQVLRSKIDFMANGALGRASSTYPFSMRYDAVAGLRKTVEEVRRISADFVVLPSVLVHWAPAIRAAGAQVIADAADVLTDVTRRIAAQGSWRNPVHKLSLRANYVSCRTLERRYFPECAEIWVTSAAESKRVNEISPSSHVVVMPNTVDISDGLSTVAGVPESIGFIGTYSYEPNLDAARRLVREIFPRVRRTAPNATLVLAGSSLHPGLAREFETIPGVTVAGRVENSAEFLASCQVIALPIKVRGGVPLKLIEAMALGRPVVASPELVDGVLVCDGADLLVGRTSEEFAGSILRLLRDPELSTRLAESAHRAYQCNYSRDALIKGARQSSVLTDYL